MLRRSLGWFAWLFFDLKMSKMSPDLNNTLCSDVLNRFKNNGYINCFVCLVKHNMLFVFSFFLFFSFSLKTF